MEHVMRLRSKYFNEIKTKKKQMEIRLLDEKRKLINIGDIIIFKEEHNQTNQIKVIVTDLIRKDTILELINEYYNILGFDNLSKEEILNKYYKFYTKEDEKKYGALGIKIKY